MLYQVSWGCISTFMLISLMVFSVLALSTPTVGQQGNSSGSRTEGGYRLLQPQYVKQQKQVEGWQLILWAVHIVQLAPVNIQ